MISQDEVLQSTYQGAILGSLLTAFPAAAIPFALNGIKTDLEEIYDKDHPRVLTGIFDIVASILPFLSKGVNEPVLKQIEGILNQNNQEVSINQDSSGSVTISFSSDVEFNLEPSSTNCFTAGTKVLTPNGEKNIEDIKVGDDVLAEDPLTGKVETHKVLQTFVHEINNVLDIHVGNEIISTTIDHLFWVVGKGWVAASALHTGDVLQEENGKRVTVGNIGQRTGNFKVYNFEVEGFHTYFVSDLGILVHNTCAIRIYTPDGNPIPFGFDSVDTYQTFSVKLKDVLPEDSEILFQGSSVTGRSYKTGEIFDLGRESDFDIALVNDRLFQEAKNLGYKAKDGSRIGPLSEEQLNKLGLLDAQKQLSNEADRDVNFMLFDSVNSAYKRPSILVF